MPKRLKKHFEYYLNAVKEEIGTEYFNQRYDECLKEIHKLNSLIYDMWSSDLISDATKVSCYDVVSDCIRQLIRFQKFHRGELI